MFQENSSNSNYEQEFLSNAHIYNNPTNTGASSNNVHTYLNSSLLITELEEALRNCKSKSPGLDGIPYLFVQNFPANARTHFKNFQYTSQSGTSTVSPILGGMIMSSPF